MPLVPQTAGMSRMEQARLDRRRLPSRVACKRFAVTHLAEHELGERKPRLLTAAEHLDLQTGGSSSTQLEAAQSVHR